LLDGTERGKELLMRTPLQRFGRVDELVGAAVFPEFGSRQFCERRDSGGGWRLSGERSESIEMGSFLCDDFLLETETGA